MTITCITRRPARVALLLAVFAAAAVARAQDVIVGGPESGLAEAADYHFAPPAPEFVPGFVPMPGVMPAPMPGFMPAPMPAPATVPLLGFMGADVNWGVRVESVGYGSIARQIGLEPGDVIVGLNGMPVRCMHDYHRALAQSGGVVALEIRDVRTGNFVTTVPFNLVQPAPVGVACASEYAGH